MRKNRLAARRNHIVLQHWAKEHRTHRLPIIGCPFCAGTAQRKIVVPKPVVKRA